MYHLNSSLPAPYELNNSMGSSGSSQMNSSQMPAMARGGRAKHKKVLAHFSPKELHVMDHLQGHTERCPKTGLRSYSHLEELFKNPHVIGNVHKHAHAERSHHAMGGNIEHLAEGGRNGDTEMALIGPHTQHLFHQIAGRSTTNPNTGHPEFFSLGGIGGALSGIGGSLGRGIGAAGRGIASGARQFGNRAGTAIGQGARTIGSGVASAARASAPHLANAARTVGSGAVSAAKAAAPHIGTAFNTLAPIAATMGTQYLADRLQGKPQQEFNPENMVEYLPESMQGIGRAAAGGYNAYRGGASPEQSFGQGLSQYGQERGGAMGNAMEGFGGAIGRGQDFRSAAGSAMSRVGQGYGGGLGESLQGAGESFGRGQDFGESLGRGINQGFQRMGGREGMINSAANTLRGYGTPGGMRGAAQREGQNYMQRALPSYFPQQQEEESYYPEQEQYGQDMGYGY